MLSFNFADSFKFFHDTVQCANVIKCQRNRYFRSGNNVNDGSVSLEDLKNKRSWKPKAPSILAEVIRKAVIAFLYAIDLTFLGVDCDEGKNHRAGVPVAYVNGAPSTRQVFEDQLPAESSSDAKPLHRNMQALPLLHKTASSKF